MRFADAHIHIAEPVGRYDDLESAEVLLGCSARPSEWYALASAGDGRAVRFYGVHPWYAGEWGPEASYRLLSVLASDPRAGVGEIGMDSKRGDRDLQLAALRGQLDIAERERRPVNIHMVGCEKDVLDELRCHRGIPAVVLHSFSAESYVRPFSDLGCLMSLNPRVLARSPERVARLLRSIPGDLLALETDAPYVPGWFTGMGGFARRLAEAAGEDPDALAGRALDNVRRAIRV